MELKEYLGIVKKNRQIFVGVILIVVSIILGYFYFLPGRYDASLTLNITRAGSQETTDYKYDDFYRLQADEKFGDTLSEWLKSPRVASDIYTAAGVGANSLDLGKLAKSFSAERRSAQIVAVNFSAQNQIQAQKISEGIKKVVSLNTEELNKDQKENTWFEIVSADPVIAKYHPDYKIILLAAVCIGIFLGFWAVLIKHYLE